MARYINSAILIYDIFSVVNYGCHLHQHEYNYISVTVKIEMFVKTCDLNVLNEQSLSRFV